MSIRLPKVRRRRPAARPRDVKGTATVLPFLPIQSLARNGDGLHPRFLAALEPVQARLHPADNVVTLADYRVSPLAQAGPIPENRAGRKLPAGIADLAGARDARPTRDSR